MRPISIVVPGQNPTSRTEFGDKQAKLWALDIGMKFPDGSYLMRLKLHDAAQNRLHLSAIRVVGSKGLLIANYKPVSYDNIAPPLLADFGRSLNVGRAMTPGVHGVPSVNYSEITFCLHVPPRPWFSFSKADTLLSIELSLEEISARRSKSKITVKSDAIPWTARAIANTA